MNPNNPLVFEALKVLLYNPLKLRKFLSSVEDPKYAIRILYDILPYRTGLEFDTVHFTSTLRDNLMLLKSGSFEIKTDGLQEVSSVSCIELRFSPFHMLAFKKLYKVIQLMYKDSKLLVAANGGLHIHLDARVDKVKGIKSDNDETIEKELLRRYKKYFNYIKTKIFQYPKGEKSYSSSGISRGGTRSQISMYHNYDTVEFRLANSTFDYIKVMKYVVCCQHIHKCMMNNNKPRFEFIDKVLSM